jgi:general secretion pathway protein K
MKSRRGFILIATLWLLVALGAVGLDAALRSRTRRLTAANILDASRARSAALAGTEYARSRLTAAMLDRADELRAQAMERARTSSQRNSASRTSVSRLFRSANPVDDPWREPSELIAPDMMFGSTRYTLRVRDTGAALNLNDADEVMLRNFFAQGLRVDYADADRLAQSIQDWRDEDEIPRVGGGEREQYVDANMAVLPPNRDFADLDELRHVMGMTEEIFQAALPYLTLSSSGQINVNAAPEPVLLALPGMTPGGAQEIVRLRESGTFPRSVNELVALVPGIASALQADPQQFNRLTTFQTNEVEIRSEGRVEGSPIHVVATVVVQRSNAGAVVVWRRIY